jgi:hypothetical protein
MTGAASDRRLARHGTGLWLIFFWIGFNAWFALTFAAPMTSA